MNEASKNLLLNAVKEWTKFVTERERMRSIATDIATVTQRIVLDTISFLKTQNVDVQCDSAATMKIMGQPVVIEPVIDATFPNVKAKVNMTCSGATRAIIINPNGSISAGGQPFMFEQLKKGIPDSFTTNAAEFVADAFLFMARNSSPDASASAQAPSPGDVQPAAAPQMQAPQAAPPPQPPRPAVSTPPRPAPAGMPPPKTQTPPIAPGAPRPAQPLPGQRKT